MQTWKVRLEGTISDELTLDLDDEECEDEEAVKFAALDVWTYTEYQDMEVVSVERVDV